MKRIVITLVLLLGVTSYAQQPVPEILFDANISYLQFGWIHEIACPSENEIYVAELLNWRVQKLTLKPAAKTSTADGK